MLAILQTFQYNNSSKGDSFKENRWQPKTGKRLPCSLNRSGLISWLVFFVDQFTATPETRYIKQKATSRSSCGLVSRGKSLA